MTRINGKDNYGSDVAVQGDGKIVVVGQVLRPSGLLPSKIALVRFNTNGTLDATFGGDGKVSSPRKRLAAVVRRVIASLRGGS
jgi:hypothetical protein